MSCTFVCNGCGKSAGAEYRFGRWQHPQGWWTRASAAGEEHAGLTACSRACIDAIEHGIIDAKAKAQTKKPAAQKPRKAAPKKTATKKTAKRAASKKTTTKRKAA